MLMAARKRASQRSHQSLDTGSDFRFGEKGIAKTGERSTRTVERERASGLEHDARLQRSSLPRVDIDGRLDARPNRHSTGRHPKLQNVAEPLVECLDHDVAARLIDTAHAPN